MKYFLAIAAALVFILPETSWACPGCVGSDGGKRDLYVVYVIMGFIALIYIPFFFLYRTIIKNRKAHEIGESEEVLESVKNAPKPEPR